MTLSSLLAIVDRVVYCLLCHFYYLSTLPILPALCLLKERLFLSLLAGSVS